MAPGSPFAYSVPLRKTCTAASPSTDTTSKHCANSLRPPTVRALTSSEVQLQMPSTLGDGAPIGHFNAWAPVQAYYTTYGIMQAWFAANGIDGLTDDHTAA